MSGDRSFFRRLRDCGWATTKAVGHDMRALHRRMHAIGNRLRPSPSSNQRSIQALSPRPSSSAKRQSLSGRYGLDNFPLHFDTSHWAIPCRFVVLACANPGTYSAPTAVLDISTVVMSSTDRALAHSSLFLVRNGRRSFYSTVLSSTRAFGRMDPGCMIPLNSHSRRVMSLFEYQRNLGLVSTVTWQSGDVLAIDNWRCLHGRIGSLRAVDGRLLLRMLIR